MILSDFRLVLQPIILQLIYPKQRIKPVRNKTFPKSTSTAALNIRKEDVILHIYVNENTLQRIFVLFISKYMHL